MVQDGSKCIQWPNHWILDNIDQSVFFFFLFLGEKPLSRKKLVNGSIKVGRVVAQVLTMLTMLTMLRLPPDKTNCRVPIRLFCIQSLDSFLRLPSYFLFWRNAAVAMMWLGDCWLFLVLRDWLSKPWLTLFNPNNRLQLKSHPKKAKSCKTVDEVCAKKCISETFSLFSFHPDLLQQTHNHIS